MNCRKCNMPLENKWKCPHCGYEDKVAKKIIYSSNWHYNQGLAKARVRDLSGAINSLTQALKYNKRNTDARNLLGLIYYHMGEIVSGLSEWVISVHFQQRNNVAAEYIQAVQNNPAKLKEANRVIQKYNLALSYVQEDNADMAIIELKRVVNMSPTYVRAYQLLGLLYMQRKQYSAARKVLGRAVKVDRNNMTTLNYLKEVNRLRGKSDKMKISKEESLEINDPNPIVIEENTGQGYTDYSTGFLSFINVLIGVVIGAAVIWLLIVPSITKGKTAEYNQAIVEYSAQISERNKTIDELEDEIDELESSLAQYEATVGTTVDDDGASEAKLMEAVVYYFDEDYTSAGNLIAEIEPDAITDTGEKRLYNTLKEATKEYVTQDLYDAALEDFESGEYVAAIEGFTKVLRMDDTWSSAVYYMGRTYHELGDTNNAAAYYQLLVESYPNSSWVTSAQEYLEAMNMEDVEAAELGDSDEETDEETTDEDRADEDGEDGGDTVDDE